MLNRTSSSRNEEHSQPSLDAQLRQLRGFLVRQDLDPSHLEGKALGFAMELASIHGLDAAREYIKRHHTTATQ